jgi:hypothetical protein
MCAAGYSPSHLTGSGVCVAGSSVSVCVCYRQQCVCDRQQCVCDRQRCVCDRQQCVCDRQQCVCDRQQCVCDPGLRQSQGASMGGESPIGTPGMSLGAGSEPQRLTQYRLKESEAPGGDEVGTCQRTEPRHPPHSVPVLSTSSTTFSTSFTTQCTGARQSPLYPSRSVPVLATSSTT